VGGQRAFYEWMLTGTDADSGKSLRLSGFEVWTIGPNRLIETSHSWYDEQSIAEQLGLNVSAVSGVEQTY
ncbi:MAG: hypothetical protein AAF404_08860, partial [Pseudomonadota bacterium]